MNKGVIFSQRRARARRGGFALVDVVALAAVAGLLILLAAPGLRRQANQTDAAICLANKQALMRAWTLYTADSNDRFPGVVTGGDVMAESRYNPYAQGWVDWGLSEANTNVNYIANARYASLAALTSSNRHLFKCPSDDFLSAQQKQRGWKQRVRSIAGSVYVGDGNGEIGPANPRYRQIRTLNQMVNPRPAHVFVYLDEHAESINDPGFYAPNGAPGGLQWVDYPANYHEGGTALSYADGHAEVHRWRGPLRTLRVTGGQLQPISNTDQRDQRFLYDRTPKAGGN